MRRTRRRSPRRTIAASALSAVLVAGCGDDTAGPPEDCLRGLGVPTDAEFVQFVDYDRARADGFLHAIDDLGAIDPVEQRATTDHYIRLQHDLGLQLPVTFLRAFERYKPTGIGVVDVRCAIAGRSSETIRLVDDDVVALDLATPHQDGEVLTVGWDSTEPPSLDRSGNTVMDRMLDALGRASVFQGVVHDVHGSGEAVGWGVARVGDRNEFVIVRLAADAGDAAAQAAAERALAASRAKDTGTRDVVDLDGATIEVVDGVAITRVTVIGGVPNLSAISSRLDPLVAAAPLAG